jgi:hypothetical protein
VLGARQHTLGRQSGVDEDRLADRARVLWVEDSRVERLTRLEEGLLEPS